MPDTTITGIRARRVWDSRGRPTVEAEVQLACGALGRAIAPAGASRGSREAIDLRDGGTVLGGMDVMRAVANVNGEISRRLSGRDAAHQAEIDTELVVLDGTTNKARLGGNATIAVSMACLHAAAAANREPVWRFLSQGESVRLPLPEVQIFGGGAHAGRRIDIQDLMVMALSASTFEEALVMTAEIYRAAGSLMAERGGLQGVADEGGWWPAFDSNEHALEMLTRAIEHAGYRPIEEIGISLDVPPRNSARQAATDSGSRNASSTVGDGRDADRLVRSLSDRFHRGPAGGRRFGGHVPVHRSHGGSHSDHRRRLLGH